MCTLILAFDEFDNAPIVVAANRDEQKDRPAVPPAKIMSDPRTIAPQDKKAGGTWIGYNEHSVFVGITNRWVTPPLSSERSRGLLVLDALEAPTAIQAILTVVEEILTRRYDGFNLVIAAPSMATMITWDGSIELTQLQSGVHVVMNAGFDDNFQSESSQLARKTTQQENARQIRRELQPGTAETPEKWLKRARAILSKHDYGVCVHENGYGTRSSSLVAIYEDDPATYRFANGPPCVTEFSPVNDQF